MNNNPSATAAKSSGIKTMRYKISVHKEISPRKIQQDLTIKFLDRLGINGTELSKIVYMCHYRFTVQSSTKKKCTELPLML